MKNLYKILLVSLALIPGVLFGQKDLTISGGNQASSLVCENRQVFVWGNIDGTSVLTPQAVAFPGDPEVDQVNSSSGGHFAAVDCQGWAYGWGNNNRGQSGTGANTPGWVATPQRVLAGTSIPAVNRDGNFLVGVEAVYAANHNSYAILDNGQLTAWGGNGPSTITGPNAAAENARNNSGQLGNGTLTGDVFQAELVLTAPNTPLENVIQVFAGDNSSYALVDDDGDGVGTVYSWGFAIGGGLGRNAAGTNNPNTNGLQQVTDGFARPVRYGDNSIMDNIVEIASGDVFGLARDEDNYVWAWGQGGFGNSTGQPNPMNHSDPRRVVAGTTTGPSNDGTFLLAKQIGGGQAIGSALTVDNMPVTWGGDGGNNCTFGGQIGQGIVGDRLLPGYVVHNAAGDVHDDVTLVNTGDLGGFYGRGNGEILAYGCNLVGQLGIGNTMLQEDATTLNLPSGCALPDPDPAVELVPGEDAEICQSVLDAGYILEAQFLVPAAIANKYTITWFRNGVQSKTGRFDVVADRSLNVTQPGTYRAVISYDPVGGFSSCLVFEDAEDEITITLPVPNFSDPGGLTYCGNRATVNVNTSASSDIYNWYPTETGGTINDTLGQSIGSNTTVIDVTGVVGTGTKTVYVESAGIGGEFLRRANDLCNSSFTGDFFLQDNQNPANQQGFEVLKPISLKSLSFTLQSQVFTDNAINISSDFNFSLYGSRTNNGGLVADEGNLIQDFTYNFVRNKTAADPREENLDVVFPVDVFLTPGVYFLSIDRAASTNKVNSFNFRALKPSCDQTIVADNIDGTHINYVGSSDQFANPNNSSGHFYDIDFVAAPTYTCGRIPVTLTEFCPCAKPSTVDAGMSFDICPGNDTTLSGSFTVGTPSVPLNGGMQYVWYQSGTTPGAYTPVTGTTIPDFAVNNVSTTNDGDWILRVQDGNDPTDVGCYTESTVNIGIKPLPSATIGTLVTICPEDLATSPIVVTPSGATAPYNVTYTATGAGGTGGTLNITGATVEITPEADGVTYTLTSVEADGCTSAITGQSVTVSTHPALVVTPATDCNNATQTSTVSATITGGVPAGYTFSAVTPGTDGAINTVAGVETFSQTFTANGNTNYAYTISDGTGCDNNEEIITGITDCSCDVMGTLTATTTTTICPGETVTLSIAATGGDGTGYTVVLNGPGATTIPTTLTGGNYVATVNTAGVYTINEVTSTGVGACTGVGTGSVTVIVRENVAITTDLTAGNVFLCPGNPLTGLTVTATGTGLASNGNNLQYQWTLNGTDIPGANTATYTKNVVDDATDGGVYQVTVTGECGAEPSVTVDVTVDEPITATFDATALNICEDAAINLVVTGVNGTGTRSGSANTEGPITYSWTSTSVNGATSSTANLDITNADGDDSGNYSVSVAGECNTVDLGPKTISVTPTTRLTVPPSLANTDLCPTDELDLNVGATPSGVTYQWQFNGTDIAGETTSNLNIPSVVAGDAGAYTVVVTGPAVNGTAGACGVETSTAVNITVGSITQITTQPTSQEDCPGGNVSFGVIATGTLKSGNTDLEYQWFKDNVAILGATSLSYQVDPLIAADAGDYFVRVEGACGIINSDIVPLVVSAESTPTVTLTPSRSTICNNETVVYTANGTGTGSSPTYEFFRVGNPVAVQAIGASNTYSPTTIGATETIEVVMTSNSACIASTATNPVRGTATVTVIAPPTATITAPATDPFLTDVNTVDNITATDLGAGYNATWTKITPTQQGNISTPGAFVTNLTGLTVIEPEMNPGLGNGTTDLRVTVRDNGNICPEAIDDITIIRKKVSDPTIDPGAVCAADITAATPFTIQGSDFNPAIETPGIIDVDNATGNGAGFVFPNNSVDLTTPPAITGNSQDFTFTYRLDNSVSLTSPSASGDLTVFATPTPANAGSDESICVNQYVLNAIVPATGLIGTGVWTCSAGANGTIVTPTSATSAIVSGINDDDVITCNWAVSNGLCLGDDDDVIITNIGKATPSTISFGGVDVTGQDLDICVNDVNALLGSTPQGGDAGAWSVTNTTGINFSGVSGSNPNQGNVTATQAGRVTLTWTISPSLVVCDDDANSVNITIHDAPDADITDIVDPFGVSVTEICEGTDVTVTTATNGPTDVATWTGGITPTGGPDSWSLLSSQLNLGNNVLTYTVNNAGCTPDTDTRSITVNPIDNISVSLNTISTLCENDGATLIATPVTSGTPTYEWDYTADAVGPVTQTSNQFVLSNLPVSNGTVTVTMTTTSACPDMPSATATVNIDVVPGPAPVILTPAGLICEDSSITINAVDNGTGDPTLVSYQWLRNGNVIPNDNGALSFSTVEPLTNVNTSGEYILRASNGICNPVNSTGVNLDVRNLPFVDASVPGTPSPLVGRSEDGVELTGTHTGLSSTWTLSPNPIASVLDPNDAISELILNPDEGGRFFAMLTSVDGPCVASDNVLVIISAPISAPNVFTPNGDGENDFFIIKNVETFPGATVRIFSRWGRRLYETTNYAAEPWDGGDVPDGVYYYIVELSPDQEKGEGHSGVIHVIR